MKKLFLILLIGLYGCDQKTYKYSVECPLDDSTFNKIPTNALYFTDTIEVFGDSIRFRNSDSTIIVMGRLKDCYIDTLN